MDIEYGTPFTGRKLERVKEFLRKSELDYDAGVQFTVCVWEGDEIIATGSLDKNVLKCIAVSPLHQGEGLSATVISELRKEAFQRGHSHLFLFTKPKNRWMFEDLSFFTIAQAPGMMLLENQRNGLKDFVASLKRAPVDGVIGCAVMNCNPFTLGHRYLIETAAAQCDWLHIFVLSEDKSLFPTEVRRSLVEQGVADLKNVTVHPTGDYLISSATFPSYFIKDKSQVGDIQCELDLEIFSRHFAPALGITRRFVGSEPLSPVTNAYNQKMKEYLPPRGIEVFELERKETLGAPISASRVRALLEQKDADTLRQLVPPTTFAYLEEHFLNK